MTIQEFSDQFDLLFNNITSNQAPGLTEHEKSVLATKAEKEVVKNYFSAGSKGNSLGQGFDDSAKRQADFSMLMKTAKCIPVNATIFVCENSDGTESEEIAPENFTFNSVGTGVPLITADNLTVDVRYEVTYAGNRKVLSTDDGAAYVNAFPYNGGYLTMSNELPQIDSRSLLYSFPKDVFVIINESIVTTKNRILQVKPLRYDEYTRTMSKPFKRPLKYQAWRLMNSGVVEDDMVMVDGEEVLNPNAGFAHKRAEIITNTWDTISVYSVRYIRTPDPIILEDLTADGLTIDGQSAKSKKINLDPILHEEVLQRAVELAKIAWTQTGQDNLQAVMQAGQRSE